MKIFDNNLWATELALQVTIKQGKILHRNGMKMVVVVSDSQVVLAMGLCIPPAVWV